MTWQLAQHRGQDTWTQDRIEATVYTFEKANEIAKCKGALVVPHSCGVKVYAVQRRSVSIEV